MLTFQQFTEGVNDPAIFKAIFLAGGPGSGKSFIVGKTGLTSMGYKVVNSDDAFEVSLKKAGLTTKPDDIFSVKGQEIRGKAKRLTAKKQERYLKGRLGIVVDGTGKDFQKISKQVKSVQALGYDTAMIFVNTDLETAVKRDQARPRTLGREEVTKMWKIVQSNIGAFQRMFGKPNMLIVDNSDDKDFKKETLRAYRDAMKFTNKEPQSQKAQSWIKQEKEKARRD
tara:strand:- start:9902 stop:10579 length:678 start_codon:yes stop_codon:yes gene_type:complete